MHEEPILHVRNLNKQFGKGCIHCFDKRERQLEKNYCPICGTVYACQDVLNEVGFITYAILLIAIILEVFSTQLKNRYFPSSVRN